MKKAITICLLLVATCAWGEWDWYGFYFDDLPVDVEYRVVGSVFDVYPIEGVWIVVAFTSFEVAEHFLQSPVMLWFDERPIANDGDTLEIDGTYCGLWDSPTRLGQELPVFKVTKLYPKAAARAWGTR